MRTVEERRFRTMEVAATKLNEAKGYPDSLRAMTASQMRITKRITAFRGDGTRCNIYKQTVEGLNADTIKAPEAPYRTTVFELITIFCAYFPDINECMRPPPPGSRCGGKVKKLVEKPDKDHGKLPRAFCPETYSRMAQVHQYLDPSTRQK
ncbi:BAR domain-containing protein [Tuber indicum]|nr:BAR domain-containing protein [Tuber indicum]